MSPSQRLCGALCLVTLCALMAVEVSAARHLLRGAALHSGPKHSLLRGFGRRLHSCSTTCFDVLGTAANFAVLASETVTNQGPTSVTGNVGDVGTFPGSSILGFPPGRLSGAIRRADSTANKAMSDAHIAYAYLQGLTYTTDLTGRDLGNMTLTPGIYHFAEGAQLTGNVTLDAQGDASGVFIFQTVSTFITSAASQVLLVNGSQPCNVFYQVGSSATLGANSTMQGSIVVYASIGLGQNTVVKGSLVATTASITMISNNVTNFGECVAPSPSTPPSMPLTPPATPPASR